jgi:hypothetical protein
LRRRVSVIVRNNGEVVWLDVRGRVSKEDEEAIKSIARDITVEGLARVVVGSSAETPKLGLIGREKI